MGRIVRSATYFVAFPLAYALAILVGRATRLGGDEIALVWPAAAVSTIWLLAAYRCGPRERAAHFLLLTGLTFVVNLYTGAAVPLAAWFVLVNVVLAAVTVSVLTYGRREVALRDPADLAHLIAAVIVGNCCGAVLAAGYFTVVDGDPPAETFALFAVRNAASALLGVAIWLRLHDLTFERPRLTPFAVLEAVAVGGSVLGVLVWAFWLNTGVPMAFLVLVPAMCLALRYSTTISTLFVTAAGIWIICATLLDRGTFIVPDLQIRALLAQAMVISLTVIVLALALYRDSRARLIDELELARDAADRDSQLLAAVLDSIHDSVILIGATGEVVLQNARASDSGLVGDVVTASRDLAEVPAPGARRDVVVEAEHSRVIELTTAPLARQSPFRVVAFRDVTEERTHAQQLREARDLFAGVLQAASEQAIIGTDAAGRITVFNNGAERLLGWTAAEMIGRMPLEFHYLPEVEARAAETGSAAGFDVFVHGVGPDSADVREWTYVRRDGTHVAVSLAISQMTDQDGRCVGYIGVATDITEQKAAEQALAESEERFRLAFDTAPMGMFMFDVTPERFGRITRCNQAMADVLGRRPDDVLQLTVTELDGLESHSETALLEQLLTLRVGQTLDAETVFRRADGGTVWGLVSASVVAPRGSEPYGICLVEDITARKRVEDELHYLASHDPLTGLANRALFMGRIDKALADAERTGSNNVGLIFLDLDGFKTVNDTWGHAQGDEVLKVVGDRLKSSIGPYDTAARLGGDEFAVLCPRDADVASLRSAAERIRAEMRRPVRLGPGRMYDQLSVSAGVVISQPGCQSETLLQRADKLMYFAKRSGKDCVTMGSGPAEEAALLREMQLTPELGRALDLHEFAVHFQPIVDLRTGECVAAEALLRWQHPERGLLGPDEFLSIAEASRFMPAIGRGVLNEACRQARMWTGPAERSAVHVNVSGRQLEVGDLRADVLNALDVSGLDPHRLVLELTETHAGRVAASLGDDLNMLRQLGIRIAIDDVGTGFSGLVKIADLPVDMLKISRHFIAGLPADVRSATISKAIVGLGTSLGMTVIAEGIERQEQRAVLLEWGCALGQGYLFGKARPGAGGIKSPSSLFHPA
ncbi:sensor domain-containing diguanylate cyclase [Mycolicibacterium chubuense]|uniref:Cyclic di-GMP phosphodiesterase Gmr n=1 Tax=Mycolicibacterium chubuense TaxID=1800 RepID=A0A0J6YKE4_MYCCU|nr:EAL domain-containing protein [Mycolicibacterium chubuense]KMO73286.1 Cyclic di-GMP phosphodiesterase Gmr [Mycolicibacterium chubuense]ORA56718.1 sensor domain-containing diguanylate cyclase [Mycolicibacterium chubuense]SPX98821.1 PAS/PAC sensor-containing diguanylate cyclase [Mycolicibacterium chubuense]